MNISYNWLKDLIEIKLSPEQTAKELTRVGLAVEGIHPHGEDFVLDVDLTSNRPDCLSHLGVAREVGVITKAEARPGGSVPPASTNTEISSKLVTIDEPGICHRFTARNIKNVEIGPSPKWLVERLEAVGERSINNIADITNYVMHELGQPMHSFDLDKLSGGRIVVRRAKRGETVKTLDEVERKLDESILAICDTEKPVSIGGVMGGFDSGINGATTNVLLEVAYFKRASIRQTSRKLGLATEASYRFERGVDIENIVRASDRATQLICELAGGEAGEFVDVYPAKFTAKSVESPDISAAVKRLTGLEVETGECLRILSALGIVEEKKSKIQNPKSKIFSAPSWRYDIAIEEDLVEEVARHTGYEKIKQELPPAYGAGEYQATEVREKLLRQTLIDMGFDEAISYSFIDTKFDDIFEPLPGVLDESAEDKFITLQDSVIEGAVRMRATILPGLLEAVRLNLNHQRRDLKLFELGKVFATKTGKTGLPSETELFSLALTGGEIQEDKAIPVRPLDFYDAKGAVEAALDAAGVPHVDFAPVDVKHLRRGQAAAISIGNSIIGHIGRLNEEISANYKFKQPVFVAEVSLQAALHATVTPVVYRPLPKYPGIVRDVSFAAKRSVGFNDIQKAVNDQHADVCRRVQFVDVYEGKGLADDERSITVRLEYRNDERTLLESEIEPVHSSIVAAVEEKLGVKQRI
ncbi:MAG: phenylalanine--tRNA ligase subunit beta [Acidobacteriota bacterium]